MHSKPNAENCMWIRPSITKIFEVNLSLQNKWLYCMYSLHQKKVYTCIKCKYSKARGLQEKQGVHRTHHWVGLNWTKPHFEIPNDCDTKKNKCFEFHNEAWPSLDQINGVCGAPPIFHLGPLSFEYLARQKCIFSFGGDCIIIWNLDKSLVPIHVFLLWRDQVVSHFCSV